VTSNFICDKCGKPFILEKGCVIRSVDNSEDCSPHTSMIYICATCNIGEKKTLDALLRHQRYVLGMTQKQLANSLEMAPNHIAMMERGERPITKRIILAVECLITKKTILEIKCLIKKLSNESYSP